MELLLSALIFASTFLLAMGLAALFGATAAERRLSRLDEATAGRSKPVGRPSMILAPQRRWPSRALERLGNRSGDAERIGILRRRLRHAGYRGQAAAAVFYGLRIVLAVGLPLLVLALPTSWRLSSGHLALILCAVTAAGWIGPSAWIDRRRNRRRAQIERTLPDALDLMVVCVEAGFGINQSLARVSQEFASRCAVLAEEFALVVHETRAGKSSTEALRGLAERTGVNDISALVALLVQTERFGTSIANALRIHADAMRVKRMQRAEERAQTAPLKLIFPSTLIFVALLLLFLAPSLSRFMAAFSSP